MKRPLPTHLISKPVKVYAYTLAYRPGILWYSVLSKGLVQGHAKTVILEDVAFKVSAGGEAKARRLHKKNPYALVCGILIAVSAEVLELNPTSAVPVRFYRNNWQGGFFGDARTGERIDLARRVVLTPEVVLAYLV